MRQVCTQGEGATTNPSHLNQVNSRTESSTTDLGPQVHSPSAQPNPANDLSMCCKQQACRTYRAMQASPQLGMNENMCSWRPRKNPVTQTARPAAQEPNAPPDTARPILSQQSRNTPLTKHAPWCGCASAVLHSCTGAIAADEHSTCQPPLTRGCKRHEGHVQAQLTWAGCQTRQPESLTGSASHTMTMCALSPHTLQ